MTVWRLIALALLLALVGGPLAVPIVAGLKSSESFNPTDLDRLGHLALSTLLLVGGTLALAMPLGIVAAALLYRTQLPGQRFFRFLVLVTLFVPPTLVTAAWQATLAHGGWLFALLGISVDSPLLIRGLFPAIFLSAVCALPWVIWLVGRALGWVESDLEDQALLDAPPWRVLWHVTLPRCRASLAAVAFWVAIQTATDISITDVMQVRTFAEEIFLELWESRPNALERCALLSAPQVALALAIVFLGLPRLERALPALENLLRPPRRFPLGGLRWPAFFAVTLGFLAFAGIPLGSLVWKVGLRNAPAEWSSDEALRHLTRAITEKEWLIGGSLGMALVAGALIAGFALLLAWLMRSSRLMHLAVLGLLTLAWALPAPVVGIGLKETIQFLVETFPYLVVTVPLYHGPSPLPVLWANLLRFLPCALAVLWPIVRLLPRDLEEVLRLDGARPGQQLRWLVVPFTARFWLGGVVVVAALALGEVGAVAMRVETPGWRTFASDLFDRLHYGVQNEVAALCLLLLMNLIAMALVARAATVRER